MARYGRKGRSVTCSYEEIIDFNTVGGSISVMGIHTPDDQTPLKMFPGLFQQFKKWKYLGCKIVGANAAQLPVDPLGVGYEAGDDNSAVADPRDIFDPIMFHGCHGEDLGAVLNRLYTPLHDLSDSIVAFTESEGSDSDLGRAAVLEGLYYKALTDRTWRKFPIQGGIRLRGLHPLVYSLATNHYISPNEQGAEFFDVPDGVNGFNTPDAMSWANGVSVHDDTRFFTPRLQRLGWMDTRLPYMPAGNDIPSPADPDEGYEDWQEKLASTQNYAMMPRIFMGVLLIPKSRRVKQFMRLRIVHYFKFAGFRGASMNVNVLGSPSFFEAESNVGDLDVPSQDDSMLGGDPNPDGPDDPPTPGPTPDDPDDPDDPTPDPPTPTEGTLTVTRGTVTVQDPDQEMSIRLEAFNSQTQQYVTVDTLYTGYASGWSGSKTASIYSNAQYRVVLSVNSVDGVLMKWTDNSSSPAPTTVYSNSGADWVFGSQSSMTIVMNGTMGE